jgi:LPXTG-motif cell wall-anchored protein
MDQTTLRIILGVLGVIIIAIIVLRRKKRKG